MLSYTMSPLSGSQRNRTKRYHKTSQKCVWDAAWDVGDNQPFSVIICPSLCNSFWLNCCKASLMGVLGILCGLMMSISQENQSFTKKMNFPSNLLEVINQREGNKAMFFFSFFILYFSFHFYPSKTESTPQHGAHPHFGWVPPTCSSTDPPKPLLWLSLLPISLHGTPDLALLVYKLSSCLSAFLLCMPWMRGLRMGVTTPENTDAVRSRLLDLLEVGRAGGGVVPHRTQMAT